MTSPPHAAGDDTSAPQSTACEAHGSSLQAGQVSRELMAAGHLTLGWTPSQTNTP